jgi:hypothetical protein
MLPAKQEVELIMRLNWRLTSFPPSPIGYRAVTDLAGDISLIVDGYTVVELQDILIIEFAHCIRDWICRIEVGEVSDFHYRSMDEEEEPLLALSRQGDGAYVVNSCWILVPARPIQQIEIVAEFSKFIEHLREHLFNKYRFNIEDAFAIFSKSSAGEAGRI